MKVYNLQTKRLKAKKYLIVETDLSVNAKLKGLKYR